MKLFKIIKGYDGKYRKFYYDSDGYIFSSCYAKDFSNSFIIGQTKEPTAQELIDEVINQK